MHVPPCHHSVHDPFGPDDSPNVPRPSPAEHAGVSAASTKQYRPDQHPMGGNPMGAPSYPASSPVLGDNDETRQVRHISNEQEKPVVAQAANATNGVLQDTR